MRNNEKYREEQKITGKTFYLDLRKIQKIGTCLSTQIKYFMEECYMTWTILYITTNEEKFRQKYKNHCANGKGLFYNINCWQVLNEMVQDGGCGDCSICED